MQMSLANVQSGTSNKIYNDTDMLKRAGIETNL